MEELIAGNHTHIHINGYGTFTKQEFINMMAKDIKQPVKLYGEILPIYDKITINTIDWLINTENNKEYSIDYNNKEYLISLNTFKKIDSLLKTGKFWHIKINDFITSKINKNEIKKDEPIIINEKLESPKIIKNNDIANEIKKDEQFLNNLKKQKTEFEKSEFDQMSKRLQEKLPIINDVRQNFTKESNQEKEFKKTNIPLTHENIKNYKLLKSQKSDTGVLIEKLESPEIIKHNGIIKKDLIGEIKNDDQYTNNLAKQKIEFEKSDDDLPAIKYKERLVTAKSRSDIAKIKSEYQTINPNLIINDVRQNFTKEDKQMEKEFKKTNIPLTLDNIKIYKLLKSQKFDTGVLIDDIKEDVKENIIKNTCKLCGKTEPFGNVHKCKVKTNVTMKINKCLLCGQIAVLAKKEIHDCNKLPAIILRHAQ